MNELVEIKKVNRVEGLFTNSNVIADKTKYKYVSVGVTSQQMGRLNKNFMQPFMTRNNIDYHAPNWDKVMHYIVGSIQEENNSIEELKLRVTELEKQLTELQGASTV